MSLDLLLAATHHPAVFALFAILAAEWALVRPGLGADTLHRVGRIDLAYGLLAMVALAAGLARVFLGPKGSGFYLDNPTFWLKLGLFIAIGLVSAVPTRRFVAWRRAHAARGTLPDAAAVHGTRRLIGAQLAAFLALPVIAAALARGVGA